MIPKWDFVWLNQEKISMVLYKLTKLVPNFAKERNIVLGILKEPTG